jgi:predicted amidohydrolase
MPASKNFRIALVQMSCSADSEANLAKAVDRVQ